MISRILLPRVQPRLLMAPGLLIGAAGMATLTFLHIGDTYALHVLPAEILLGVGMGAMFVPAFSTATLGVGPRDAGRRLRGGRHRPSRSAPHSAPPC